MWVGFSIREKGNMCSIQIQETSTLSGFYEISNIVFPSGKSCHR
jgi:hypothetical protein